MTKLVKLSLAAAVATAGLTTTASAVSLEEAIKGVNVSGQFQYRMNDKSFENGSSTTSTDVEIEVGVKVPVTDTVTAVFKIDNANDDTDTSDKGAVTIEDYYFAYNNGATTVHFGQQNIPGSITDGAQGDGLVALYNLGDITVGGAAFTTNTITNDENVVSVIAMGNIANVAFGAQYADVADISDTFNLKASTSVEGIKLAVEYTETDEDGNSNDRSTLEASIATTIAGVSASVTYAATGDNGSGSIDQALEAGAEQMLWNVGTAGREDYESFTAKASYPLTSAVTLTAAYTDGEEGSNSVTETFGQVAYKVSKNLSAYLRHAEVEDNAAAAGEKEFTRSRVQVRYTF